MQSPNEKTIEAYNQNLESYIKQTPLGYEGHHAPLLRWIDDALLLLKPGESKILEIGSGTGREARYIKYKGYDIVCSDAAQAFIDYLNSRGEKAILFNVLKDEFPDTYNMLLANAVLPHFTREDLGLILNKAHSALLEDGIFALSAKQGKGSTWTSEKFHTKRYIHYWSVSALEAFIRSHGYEIIFMECNIPGDLPTHTWINLTAKKI